MGECCWATNFPLGADTGITVYQFESLKFVEAQPGWSFLWSMVSPPRMQLKVISPVDHFQDLSVVMVVDLPFSYWISSLRLARGVVDQGELSKPKRSEVARLYQPPPRRMPTAFFPFRS